MGSRLDATSSAVRKRIQSRKSTPKRPQSLWRTLLTLSRNKTHLTMKKAKNMKPQSSVGSATICAARKPSFRTSTMISDFPPRRIIAHRSFDPL
ncbi:hypothetical protein BDW66DRAFT_127254 [Aspergillus desertorum]